MCVAVVGLSGFHRFEARAGEEWTMRVSWNLPRPALTEDGAQPLHLRWIGILILGPLLVSLIGIVGCGGDKKGGGNSGTGPDDFDVTVTLTVQGAGNGHGQVSGSQISCQIQAGQASGTGCQGTLTINSRNLPTTLTLTATASQGSAFVSWGGSCAAAGTGSTCQLSVTSSSRNWTFTSSAQFDLLPGAIQVTTVTGGSDLDPDGYTVTIDQTGMGAIETNGVKTYSGLASGVHAVALEGIAGNCTVDGGNPRDITVDPGATAQTTFNVTCVPTTGDVQVTTVTGGNADDLDPDGYTVTIDQNAPVAIGINATETFSQLTPGDHIVTLGDIAANCALDDGENPRTVAVIAGQTTSTPFNLTCSPPPGSIEVTTSTGGDNLPGNDYTVSIDQGAASSIGINATVTIGPLSPGDHEVALGGVPANCTVTDDNPRWVTVVAGATAQTAFEVQCVQSNLLAFERVSDRGDKDICVLDPNVGEASVVCLTGGPGDTADDVHPTWGPNQNELIFASDRDGDFEIFRMNPDGTGVTQLTDNTFYDSEPDYYVGGLKIVFTSDRSGNKDVWQMVLNQQGYPVQQLTTDPASDFNPAWAWDSGWWMWTSNRDGDQDIYQSAGGVAQPLTLFDDDEDDAMWLPPVLYFASDRNGTWDVFRRHSFTGETALYDGPSKDVAPSPAPDGIWVAFATNKDGNFEIYKRNTTTQELVRLTDNQTSDSRPAWFAYFF